MADSDRMKTSIADYIIDTLADVGDLDTIKSFVRGALPPGMVPNELYPSIEVMVAGEAPEPGFEELTGGYYRQVYTGLITVAEWLVHSAGGDFLDKIRERIFRVISYDLVDEVIGYTMTELQKCEHRSMGDLVIGDEAVINFSLSGQRIYGLDKDARTNNWENFGSIVFTVQTIRQAADV